jgi:hypothetical protein
MSLTAAPTNGPRFGRGSLLAVIGIGVAAAVSVATVSNPWLGNSVRNAVNQGVHGVETVAAMLAERSPGARPEGALVNLKHKKKAALHERALPKVRGPYAPPTAYEALSSPPPVAPVVPPEAPLFATIAGGPPAEIPPAGAGSGGGPPILSDIPPPGGGSGGFTPPITTTETPSVPTTPVSPVPEPRSWAMMLLGFAFVGWSLRRGGFAGSQPASE